MPQPEALQTESVFLSYSHTDREACIALRAALEKGGSRVFHDVESLRAGGKWMEELQQAIDGCSAFVVLVGRDGVRRWVGAETQAALNRHFGAHDDQRLPIFPILLGDTPPDTLPAFLRLFQATAWNGADPLHEQLLDAIRDRAIVANAALRVDGSPFVGLDAYLPEQAHLFFGRQKETLDALACFDTRAGSATVRWLEINGNSGSGKSSLMNAGLLPLVDQGWLWPRTGYERWRRIGPLMPGEDPVQMLAEHLARSFGGMEMTDVRERLERGDERVLAEWLRTRRQSDHDAFLLAVDQFEELFTFADPKQRARFDSLLATALADSACPLFVISTVRADFLDRFEDLPRLLAVRNRLGKAWTLPAIGGDGLREVIDGPARLAGADVSEVREAIVSEAFDEPGALPLVENALHWLWEQGDPRSGKPRLSGKLFTAQGGLAGILSRSADDLLERLGKQRERALELLFRLVKVDPEGLRHTRRRIPLAEAVAVAGGGDAGRNLVNVLAGGRARDGGKARGPLRLITVTMASESTGDVEAEDTAGKETGWVNLIHETLIRSKGSSAEGKPQPYWPTLWNYVDQHKERAARREHLQLLARQWKDRRGMARLFGLVGWLDLFGFRGLAVPGSLEQRYLRWSSGRALVTAGLVAVVAAAAAESVYWAKAHDLTLESVTTRWAHKLGKTLPMPKLAPIPAGRFEMGAAGSQDTEPVHPVTFARPFYLGQTEVTFAQYDAFCEATACSRVEARSRGDDQPVVYVSWFDARAYANWLGAMTGAACRLPSEAEWEYAARAGTKTAYALPARDGGSDNIRDRDLANCDDCGAKSRQGTTPVKSFPANAWKLYDMHGNVWEWVEDCWHDSYQGAPQDGRAWLEENGARCSARALRGGGWRSSAVLARSAARLSLAPADRYVDFGFRVLCSSSIE